LSLDRSAIIAVHGEQSCMSDANSFSSGGTDGCDSADGTLAVATPGEEWCPILATGTLLGNRWVPAIVDRLLDEPHRFVELREALPGVSSKVLSDTLDRLVEQGVVEHRRSAASHHPFQYALTGRGRSLRPVVAAMRAWGDEQVATADDPDTARVHI
jgi:DNA-binding HxlR family transcriptional regulator